MNQNCFCCENQKLYQEMLSVDSEDTDWEIYFVTCLACGCKSTISLEDYESLEQWGEWYVLDEYAFRD